MSKTPAGYPDFALLRERLEGKRAAVESEREALAEAIAAEAYRELGDDPDKDGAERVAEMAERAVALDAEARSLLAAGTRIDSEEQAANDAKAAAQRADLERRLEKAITACEKCGAKVADDLICLATSVKQAKVAEEAAAKLAREAGMSLVGSGVARRLDVALAVHGIRGVERISSLDFPAGPDREGKSVEAIRARRTTRARFVDPMGSGPVAAHPAPSRLPPVPVT
jgi:hypothetical protein